VSARLYIKRQNVTIRARTHAVLMIGLLNSHVNTTKTIFFNRSQVRCLFLSRKLFLIHYLFLICYSLFQHQKSKSINQINTMSFCEIRIEFYSTSTEAPFEKTIIINNYFYFFIIMTLHQQRPFFSTGRKFVAYSCLVSYSLFITYSLFAIPYFIRWISINLGEYINNWECK
jgi:hypothetical protein